MANRKFLSSHKHYSKPAKPETPKAEMERVRKEYAARAQTGEQKLRRKLKREMIKSDELEKLAYIEKYSELRMWELKIKQTKTRLKADPIAMALFVSRVVQELVHNDPEYIEMWRRINDRSQTRGQIE